MSCPDLMLLSQLLDGELAADDAAPIREHVDACAACHARLDRLERAVATWRTAIAASAPPPARLPGVDCLAPDRLAGWTARALPADDLPAIEAHLQGCDICLDDALGALRLMARLDAGPDLAVPEPLRGRVASRWGAPPSDESLAAVVIRIARAGVTLLDRRVLTPVMEIEELAAALPAVRTAEGKDTVSFRIRAPEGQICATVVSEGAAVGVTLMLLGKTEDALGGQRVFLRRHGRSIYSARTDEGGALTMPRIEPGVYEIFCPGIATSFRLDLRA